MPRINQLQAASSVASTDVVAIDTQDKTYRVPKSTLFDGYYTAAEVDAAIAQSTANKAYSIETVSESSVIDFDDIWQYGNGIYSIKIPANSTSKPVAGTEAEYWYVFQATFYRNYTYGIQIASRSINSTNVYMRKRTNGTNGSWSRITFNAY